MPMTEHKMPGDQAGAKSKQAGALRDDELAALVSAYLDGELAGKDLEGFESLLKREPGLAREVTQMRTIELQLMEMGADIRAEPVPEAMLEAFCKLGRS